MLFPSPLAQRFAAPIGRIRETVAAHAAANRLLCALLCLVHARLGRMLQRLDRLALRWQAGRLPTPRPPLPPRRNPGQPNPAAPPARPKPVIPSGHAWLFRLAQPAAQLAPQIQQALAHPDTQALVAAAPQAGRLLRPLCRMLGIAPPPWLRLPPRPPRPNDTRQRDSRPLSPRPSRRPSCQTGQSPPDPPRVPLPAYVRAAARAWRPKFG